jgi:hypothetical protein
VTTIVIENLGGAFSGHVDRPTLGIDAISIRDGRIISHASDAVAETRIDARGAWAMPGLWDGWHRIYFGDHEPVYQSHETIAASVGYGVTSLIAGPITDIPGWQRERRADRELAILTSRSWRFDRPCGINVVTHAQLANPDWTLEDLDALRESGTRSLILRLDSDPFRIGQLAREHGLEIGVWLEGMATQPPANWLDELCPSLVVLDTGERVGLAAAIEALNRGASTGVTLGAGPRAITEIASEAARGNHLNRIFLGSGLPGAPGVLSAGIPLAIDLITAAGILPPEEAIALASGNVARAYGLLGGTLDIGDAADISLVSADRGEIQFWANKPQLTLIAGNVIGQLHGEGGEVMQSARAPVSAG